MVTTAGSVEWTVVSTEVEALQLEYNWIKEFDPRFNVRYRDDKTYPVLAVTLNEEFPRLFVYRGPRRKGVRYFGPYSHAWAIRETLDLLLRVFRSEEHTSELQSLMRISYAVFCLKQKSNHNNHTHALQLQQT